MDPAAVAAQFAPLFSAFPDWNWEMRHLVVDRDYIAVRFAVTGTHRGTFQGIEATSKYGQFNFIQIHPLLHNALHFVQFHPIKTDGYGGG